MATGIHRLSPRTVHTAGDGDYNDGNGLWLRVADGRGAWVFRYTAPSGKRREMGLGKLARNTLAAAGQSLTRARDEAADARRLLREGIDPLDRRNEQREQARRALQVQAVETKNGRVTLARVARDYHSRVIEPSRSAKHAFEWLRSLENHLSEIWHTPVADIQAPALLDALIVLQGKVPETAARIRQRLEAIFDDAEFRGLRADNPARAIRRKLSEGKKRRVRGSFAALPYSEVPAFMTRVRGSKGIAARALEFTVLTAARTGEAVGATREEFDLEAGIWTVPGARMKGGEPHSVYLSPRALEIVKSMVELGQPYAFPAPSLDGKPLSNMAMLAVLRRLGVNGETTVHGLARAAFSTWANETGAARPDVVEACLAHKEADRIRAAYNRAQFAEERAALLRKWADFIGGETPEQGSTDA